jgi:hypothetical protein
MTDIPVCSLRILEYFEIYAHKGDLGNVHNRVLAFSWQEIRELLQVMQ